MKHKVLRQVSLQFVFRVLSGEVVYLTVKYRNKEKGRLDLFFKKKKPNHYFYFYNAMMIWQTQYAAVLIQINIYIICCRIQGQVFRRTSQTFH